MERAEQLRRHLVSEHWAENGGTMAEAEQAIAGIDWADCGGFDANVDAYFTNSEQTHLIEVTRGIVILSRPWLSCAEVQWVDAEALERMSPEDKRLLLNVPV